MIKEIQKRPFVRPLFIWIIGILLQAGGSVQPFSFFLLVLPVGFLLLSNCFGKQQPEVSYRFRWVWGSIFLSLLLFLSIQTTAYHENKAPSATPSKIQLLARQAQQKLLEPIDNLSLTEKEKAVLSTITLGYKESISKDVRQQFSITGVAHLLAISGFHVAIVCGFISSLLSFLSIYSWGRWLRYLLTIVLLWTFACISGLAASAVRSAIMLTLYLTGKQVRRTTDSYNTLAASAFCMLVYNPLYLFDIGFQLSYTAVFFILYLQPKFNQWIEVRNPILAKPWSWLTVTLAAQAGVTFLCLYYFGQFSSVFLFTNLPLTGIASLLIPLTLLRIVLPGGFPGTHLLQYIIEFLTHSMMWIVDTFSRIPGSTFAFRFTFRDMIGSYILLFILLLYYKKPYIWSVVFKKVVHLVPKI